MNLTYNSRITCASRSSDAGSTANNSHAVDMSGFDSVMFIAKGNSEWESTQITMNLYGSTVSTTAGNHLIQASTITASTGGVAASSANQRLFIMDVNRDASNYRYLWAQVYSDSTFRMDWTAIQYNPRFPGSTDLYDSTSIAQCVTAIGATT
ncbi:MAG: hypothetical protein SWQ30_06580 [Thermodesulfobacteriota bacterium]|nr:hypothetical protein [Thermodesulfobacteriota bacterium]